MPVIETRTFEEWKLPCVIPMPLLTEGVESPVILLDQDWQVTDGQRSLTVPCPYDLSGEFLAGFGRIYEYTKSIILPSDAAGKRIVLQFEGINGFADVFINDIFCAHHENGFLTWNIDLTELISGALSFGIRIHVDETKDLVSSFSHGGMLCPAKLLILPDHYLQSIYATALPDEMYQQCRLQIEGEIRKAPADLVVRYVLANSSGEVILQEEIETDNGRFWQCLDVPQPIFWDAEYPRLYTLALALIENGHLIEEVQKEIGLRKVEKRGNQLFVNGKEVKLHGVCRHEIMPDGGRATTHEMIEKDVRLFREANINYIRTSHYPPNEYFLTLCDRYGIYVEDELALAFVAKSLPYTQRDPALTDRYISHFTECCARDYNHPCVIIWSLSNESFSGYNFDLMNRYVHYKDPTRVTKFSYPMTIREEYEMPDLWSIHYSEYSMDLSEKRDNVSVGGAPGKEMPVIHDEFCHVACYNREELRRDPYVRIFWGAGPCQNVG